MNSIPLPPSQIEVMDNQPKRVPRVFDVECYINYYLIKFYNPAEGFTKFVLNAWTPLDRAGLIRMLQTSISIGFNSSKYDIPMAVAALAGYTNQQLKALTNEIIGRELQSWETEREFNLVIPDYIDHVDLIEVMPGQASLKAYGGKMHSKKLQDLPIRHDKFLTPDEMVIIDLYNDNDLTTTWEGREKFLTQLDLRVEMTAQYGIDLRSKSDAQIAEALFKQAIQTKIYPPHISPGTPFTYKIPNYIKFRSEQLNRALEGLRAHPFVVTESGGAAPNIDNRFINWADKALRLDVHGNWVKRPRGWEVELIQINKTFYQMGTGGLHSCEKSTFHREDLSTSLQDVDVVSYYPEIMCQQQLYPPQIGPGFLTIFGGWKAQRVAAKKAKKKKQADGEKTKINGTFGKTGSKYSILYMPSMMIQVTISGQLCLLMLIELLEGAGIQVVSANTDGVVIKCPRELHGLRDLIVKHWETITGFETEAANYRAIYSRDVNNYMAFKDDGTVKLKGEAFAPPEPVGPSWPNPTNEICADAVVAYIADGTPIERTIRGCSDIRKFVNVRQVKGGGHWLAHDAAVPEYLGKVVRWYYAVGCERSTIRYVATGNMVADSKGARACMTLPDILPPDINYLWYIDEAIEKLRSVGL